MEFTQALLHLCCKHEIHQGQGEQSVCSPVVSPGSLTMCTGDIKSTDALEKKK